MDQRQAAALGDFLRKARESKHLYTRELSSRTGISQPTIVRIERGKIKNPRADILATLAGELNLPLGDVYAFAEYTIPNQLPSFAPYLRARYGSLPAEATAELEEAFGRVVEKYGYDREGPQPGQDER